MLCTNCYSDMPAGSTYCTGCSSTALISAGGSSLEDSSSDSIGYSFGYGESNRQVRPAPAVGLAKFRVHPNEQVVATRGYRLLAAFLDVVLNIVTFGFGWFIWFLFIAGRGQTPAKQLMRLRVVRDETGGTTFPTTFFRYYLINLASWLLFPFTVLGLFSLPYAVATIVNIVQGASILLPLVDAAFIFTASRKRLVDRLFRTTVYRF